MGKDNEDGAQEVFRADLDGAHTTPIHMPLARTPSQSHLNAGGWEMYAQKEEGRVGPGSTLTIG